MEAIKDALRALRKRHLLEEGAHAPAFSALSQGLEWKEKAEKLELELQQCYKAQSRLSEQLVVEVAVSKASVQDKELLIDELQTEVTQTREEFTGLRQELDLLIAEKQEGRAQLEEMTDRWQNAETDNQMLIDRWMLQKMQDAERFNEVTTSVDLPCCEAECWRLYFSLALGFLCCITNHFLVTYHTLLACVFFFTI